MIAAVAAAVAAATIAAATPAADVRDDHAALGALSCEQLFEQFGAYYGRKKSLYPPTSLDDELDDALHAQQHVDEGTCAHRRLLLYEPHDCGLGAELHWTAVMLHAALVTNRTLVIREDVPWLYAGTSERCAHRGGQFSCYFAPLSTCTARTAVELQALLGNDYAGIADVPWFRTTALAENHDARVVRFVTNLQDQLDARFQRSAAPTWHTAFYTNAALRAATTPEFWFRSRLMNFLWRPRDELRAAAAATRARLGLGRFDAHTCVALHTRRGDKVHGSPSNGVEMADVVGVARPLRVLAAIAARCPDVHAAYVSTRDPALVAELERRYGASGGSARDESSALAVYWNDRVHRYGRGYSTHDLVAGRLNRTEEALGVINDVLLMSECGIFAGVMESNLSRLVLELGAAAHTLRYPAFAIGKQTWWVNFP
mmetsp:Transcript_55552/g.136292  ORF Transcript_55552/g.136292 Transcript_55552/m.136292 type:complete len:429 (-) Transcript_55552:143-1429(-)|eukprot:CAMPEP_0198326244 /NCGR_PEP_ID=MMETSP1450-20131203/13826_1 /TAXON_ID=753684 ORGANISM="Madagascaria erythrocladiodes, Strain CCMP3234" /NCGR_SAMPLE_ID=MMETSP1450 /ASSEMBLY_ACC=CAM_ASM_001115 /LENGTH=428 /DNA_ID=CAMNT_0044030195 /DNA_START=111 /DNA_END=1397 /DNA_ORIENTATION=+